MHARQVRTSPDGKQAVSFRQIAIDMRDLALTMLTGASCARLFTPIRIGEGAPIVTVQPLRFEQSLTMVLFVDFLMHLLLPPVVVTNSNATLILARRYVVADRSISTSRSKGPHGNGEYSA
jgi:hypothetical protein